MPMYNLIEYSDNCSKTSGSLWHYYRDGPFLANDDIASFATDNNNNASFKFKTNLAGRTKNNGTQNVKIIVPLKYLSNFWRTVEMPLINCEINLILAWSNRCFIIDNLIDGQEPTFAITDTKLCSSCSSSTLSTQDNAKMLEQLKSGFKEQLTGISMNQK